LHREIQIEAAEYSETQGWRIRGRVANQAGRPRVRAFIGAAVGGGSRIGEATVAEALKRGKQADTDVGIFTPEQMEKLMKAATEDLIPILAIGGFAGLRGAEIARLNWSAVDLGRKIIELRAGQAKTASRRIVPITDNLAGWLAKIERNGPVVPDDGVFLKARRLAKSLGIPWPHNALRHSYISYRIAVVQSAAQVALEAGNSPAIIFKHYRELVTKESADQWFGIMP
jgi:integrase